MRRKTVFLDCDGVLNKNGYADDMRYFHPDCFAAFRDIIARTDAVVVLSSSWRQYKAWYEMLRDFFGAIGIPLVGKTGERMMREEEIAHWLRTHADEVETYVVLDDWDLSAAFPGHFVQTCAPGRIGLDAGWAEAAVAILNGRTPPPAT